MQITHLPAMPEWPQWFVILDCDEERRLSDEEIVRLLEHCQGITWHEDMHRYALNGLDLGPKVDGIATVRRNGDILAVTLHF